MLKLPLVNVKNIFSSPHPKVRGKLKKSTQIQPKWGERGWGVGGGVIDLLHCFICFLYFVKARQGLLNGNLTG